MQHSKTGLLLAWVASVTLLTWTGDLGAREAADAQDEYAILQTQMAAATHWNLPRLQREACHAQALIQETDRQPADVVLRRTQALLEDLQKMSGGPDFTSETASLEALSNRVKALHQQSGATAQEWRGLYTEITAVRRQIALKNPLLDFPDILFLKHNKQVRGYRHMVDQYLGFNAEKSGGVFVLRQAFGGQPTAQNLLSQARVQNGRLQGRVLDNQGGFLSLELDYDARRLLFAFTEAEYRIPKDAPWGDQYCQPEEILRDKGAVHHHFRPDNTYHIFQVNLDGSDLRQLTDGMWNEYDPCFLPNGRIAFISERAGGQVRCGMRPLPTATLHAMMPDGSDIIQLSWHETQEWHPSVDNHGMLVYTRWDYVDRDSDVAHHLWTSYPDGRDPRSPHGNYPAARESRPWMEMSIRAIPNSHQYVAVAAPHHGEAYGSLVMIDPQQKDDRATAQLRRITPEVPFPESESAPGVPHAKGTHKPLNEYYGTPWPLSEKYFLCVYDAGQRHYALCLLDVFGNRELLYRDPSLACLDPIPLRPRPRPPVIPSATQQARADRAGAEPPATGTVAIMNVYDSRLPWPQGTQIKEVRVINIFPKDNPYMDEPYVGFAQALARGVLGTAPVETDGSAHFTLPAGAPVYFQLLDAKGLAVQTMRSDTYVHPGETLVCGGCHESRHARPITVSARTPLAMQRAPSALRPEVGLAYPLTFPRLVQPVLDSRCVTCHAREPKAPSLRGDRFGKYGWSEAYGTLKKYAWGMSGGNGMALKERQFSIPGQDGARASRLYALLDAGHHDLKLAPEELRRITLWLDANSSFYGAYTDLGKQARGELVKPRWGMPKWASVEAWLAPRASLPSPPEIPGLVQAE